MNNEKIKEIEERCNRATEGPWVSFIEGRDHISGSSFIRTKDNDIELIGASTEDQDFIANARQDIPILIREIYKLKEIIEKNDRKC